MPSVTEELFDIVDENNRLLGITKTRQVVHAEMKDWHRATGIWIVNDAKQFLCQQRSLKKDADPGKWQPYFGGHLKAGEMYEQNAVAELEEELGLRVEPKNLVKAHMIKSEHYLHFSQQYIYFWNGGVSELRFKDGEVEQVRWMSVMEYEDLMRTEGIVDFKFNEKILEFIHQLDSGVMPTSETIEISESAGGVVLNGEHKVLVVSQHGTSWSLPKGHINPQEDTLEAARREIYEESGISQRELLKELGSYARYGISLDGGDDKRFVKTIHMYLFRTGQSDLKPVDPENPEAVWLNKDEVVSRLTHYKDREFFLEAMKKLTI